jgi:protein-disulfide isomerase
MWVGANDAPVTIIEYASLTCPSCARFHNGIFADLVGSYIDDGRVRFIYRDFPLDDLALRAAMLARCAGESSFFGMLDFLFEQQANWTNAENPLEALLATVKKAGMGEQASKACLENKQVENFVLQSRLEGETKHGVHSTPTLVIGDTVMPGPKNLEEVLAVVDPLVQAGGNAGAPDVAAPSESVASDEPGPYGTWLLVGGVVVALLVGARLYARRRKT